MVSRKIKSLFIASSLLFSLVGTATAAPVEYGKELQNAPSNTASVSFADLPTSHWAYSYIAEMVNKKVLDGYPDNKFRPNNTISRAEFATIIIKAAGLQAKKVNYSSFSDIKVTDWYSPFVETAKDYLTGFRSADGNYIFNPTAPALREDITVALVKLKGYDVTRLANRSIVEAMFKDFDGVSESAKDYVAVAVENGLVSGYEDETFRPQASITRAEAATLLWRAYQYGNDNKGVGGQGNTSTTPTPAVTQPSTNPGASTLPSQAMKFSVDTLVGGMGAGSVDGSVSVAKINAVDSMALDKDDNIYFLDSSLNKVRRFNKSNGSVETLTINDTSIGNKFKLDENSKYQLLRYNSSSNKMHLAAYLGSPSDTQCSAIYEINPTVSQVTYAGINSCAYHFGRIDFVSFLNADSLLYGVYWFKNSAYNDRVILKSTQNTEASLLGSVKEGTAPSFGDTDSFGQFDSIEAISTSDNIWIFDTNQKRLTRTHVFPRKIDTIKTFENISFDAVTSYNNKFYASSGTTIYEISLDGQISTFIDGRDLIYNDGNKITKISQLSFDKKGNVIIYDDSNKAIRRINL